MALSIGVHASDVVRGGTSVTTPARTTTPGSFLIVAANWDSGVTFVSLDDNKANSLVQVGGLEVNGGGHRSRVYVKENAAGGPGHTFTFTISGSSYATLLFVEIPGAALSSALDQFDALNKTPVPYTLPSGLTTTQPDELLFVLAATDTGSNPADYSEGGITGMTKQEAQEDGTNDWTAAIFTKIVSSTGTFNPIVSGGSGTSGHVWLATFKAATGSGVDNTQAPSRHRMAIPMRPGPGGLRRGKPFRFDTTNPATILERSGNSHSASRASGSPSAIGAGTGASNSTGLVSGTGIAAAVAEAAGASQSPSTAQGAPASIAAGAGGAPSQSGASGSPAATAAGDGASTSQSVASGAGAAGAAAVGASVSHSVAVGVGAALLPVSTPARHPMVIPMRPAPGGLVVGRPFRFSTVMPQSVPTVAAAAGVSVSVSHARATPAPITAADAATRSQSAASGGAAPLAGGVGASRSQAAASGSPAATAAGDGSAHAPSTAAGSSENTVAVAGVATSNSFARATPAPIGAGAGNALSQSVAVGFSVSVAAGDGVSLSVSASNATPASIAAAAGASRSLSGGDGSTNNISQGAGVSLSFSVAYADGAPRADGDGTAVAPSHARGDGAAHAAADGRSRAVSISVCAGASTHMEAGQSHSRSFVRGSLAVPATLGPSPISVVPRLQNTTVRRRGD